MWICVHSVSASEKLISAQCRRGTDCRASWPAAFAPTVSNIMLALLPPVTFTDRFRRRDIAWIDLEIGPQSERRGNPIVINVERDHAGACAFEKRRRQGLPAHGSELVQDHA